MEDFSPGHSFGPVTRSQFATLTEREPRARKNKTDNVTAWVTQLHSMTSESVGTTLAVRRSKCANNVRHHLVVWSLSNCCLQWLQCPFSNYLLLTKVLSCSAWCRTSEEFCVAVMGYWKLALAVSYRAVTLTGRAVMLPLPSCLLPCLISPFSSGLSLPPCSGYYSMGWFTGCSLKGKLWLWLKTDWEINHSGTVQFFC